MTVKFTFRCACNNEWEGDETQRVCSQCDATVGGPIKASWESNGINHMQYYDTRGLPLNEAVALPRRIAIQNVAHEIGNITADKNAAYGNSVATVDACLKVFFPSGIPTRKFRHAMLLTRILDKMMRIANEEHAFGESPYRDIAGYAIMGALINNEPAGEEE